MSDVRLMELAARQHRCLSRADLHRLGYTDEAIAHRVATGRLLRLHPGVYAAPPVLEDEQRTWWMAATLTAPRTFLADASAAAAYGLRAHRGRFQTVVRAGDGGPERFGGVHVRRSRTLAGETTYFAGIPITTPERTMIDLVPHLDRRGTKRAVREALRLGLTTEPELVAALARHRGRRGTRRLGVALSAYAGLPLDRCRSASEAQAPPVPRAARIEMPVVNRKFGGEEADLVWPSWRLIAEIGGGPFDLDRGEDARKERVWRDAGYTVRRVPSEAVWQAPAVLLAHATPPNVGDHRPGP